MIDILLAEDNPADRYLIQEAFKQAAILCSVRTASNGGEALELIADGTWRPRLIILDLNLPRHDGLEVLQSVRAMKALADVPVVILTSSDSPEERDAALKLGATRFLRKPSELDEFLHLGNVFQELLVQSE